MHLPRDMPQSAGSAPPAAQGSIQPGSPHPRHADDLDRNGTPPPRADLRNARSGGPMTAGKGDSGVP